MGETLKFLRRLLWGQTWKCSENWVYESYSGWNYKAVKPGELFTFPWFLSPLQNACNTTLYPNICEEWGPDVRNVSTPTLLVYRS